MHKGVTGTNLLVILERRLDNVVFRLVLPIRATRPASSFVMAFSPLTATR